MNSGPQKKMVAVLMDNGHDRYQRLFHGLSELYPVEFREVTSIDNEAVDGVLVLNGRISEGVAAAARGIPAYIAVGAGAPKRPVAGSELHFAQSSNLDVCLRRQVMVETQLTEIPEMCLEAGDEVLASKGGNPVWLNRPVGAGHCQMVAVAPPVLAKGELLFTHLSGGKFLALLPLISFLRQIVQQSDWQPAPTQACFVLDDPSLYWPSYGFLDYRLLAKFAREHEFHVAIATIPLDTWWVNSSVASIFASHNPFLSVIMHGNNHTAREMLVENGAASHLQMAAQALRRAERLELRHGFAAYRIMEAPHGGMAYGIVRHLASLGYEAVLCTKELLLRHNPGVTWPAEMGMDRADFSAGGLPAISRIKMSTFWRNEVIFSSFLRQPFVVAGHHYDAADHFRTMEAVVQQINDLRCVSWSSPQDIVRSNYKYFRCGDDLNLKMYSRRINLTVPEGVAGLFVHRPWLELDGETEELVIRLSGRETYRARGGAWVGPVPIETPGKLEIKSPSAHPVDFRKVKVPRLNAWPFTRKLLMEVRDRTSPFRFKAMRLLNGPKARLPGKKEDY